MAADGDAAPTGAIGKVQRTLGAGSPAAAFARVLYGRNGLDGVGTLEPAWLAANARDAFAFIAEKKKGRHRIGVRRMPATGALAESSVVEILNDDMPFLVDSVMGEIQARGLPVRLLLHPILKTQRDNAGRLEKIDGAANGSWKDASQESYIAIYVRPMTDAAARDLTTALSAVLDEVRGVVADWAPMMARVKAAAGQLETVPDSVPRDVLSESRAFLAWLEAGNFTFLGVREFELEGDPETGDLVVGGRQRASAFCATPACRCCAAAASWWR